MYAWGNARNEGLTPQHGLMSHATLAQKVTTRKAFDEAFRKHNLPQAQTDLPTVPASDLPTPSTIADAEASEHAEMWRGSRVRESAGPHVRFSVAANR